jgi:hypothetical protein
MQQPDSISLILLIRLLHDDLPPDDGIRLRERLAEDLPLARRLQTLLQTIEDDQYATALLQPADDCHAEDVATFVERRMSDDRESAFEQQCWESSSLLKEVVSCWRARNQPAGILTVAISEQRMLDVASKFLDKSDRLTVDLLDADVRRANGVARRASAKVTQSPRRKQAPVVIACLTVAVIVGGIVAFSGLLSDRRGPDAMAEDTGVVPESQIAGQGKTIAGAHNNERNPDLTGQSGNDLPLSIEPGGQNESPIEHAVATDDAAANETGSGGDRAVIPTGPLDVPRPERPLLTAATITDMKDIQGVIAVLNSDTKRWQGVSSRPGRATWSSQRSVRLMSMIDSRGDVRLESFGGVVIDADTDLIISMREAAPPGDVPELRLLRGRFGMSLLPPDSHFVLDVNHHEISIAVREMANLTVDRSAGGVVVNVFRGALEINGSQVPRRSVARVRRDGQVSVLPDPLKAEEWHRDRDYRSALPIEICDRLNASDDLVRQATSVDVAADSQTAFLATQVLLQCSTATTKQLPLRNVQRLAMSHQEGQRHSLVHWLLTRLQQQPAATNRTIQQVCDQLKIGSQPSSMLKTWYSEAANGNRPTANHLRGLLTGLQNKDHIFVRQSAKYFLQSILGDPLNAFDPGRPTDRAAIQSVTRKLRAWQQANRPL